MGGTLDPESTPGGGLTMALRLRTAELDALQRPPDPAEHADPALLDRLSKVHPGPTTPGPTGRGIGDGST